MKNSQSFVVPAGIIAGALVLASLIGAFAFLRARGYDNALSVTGSAKEHVAADSAKWTFNISRRAYEGSLQTAYSQVARDLETARKFLADNGVAEGDITVTPTFTEEMYKYNGDQGGPREFTVRQMITIQSDDPSSIDKLSKATSGLSAKGVLVMADQPQYYYSKLADLRVRLLGAAVTDARARANEIASSAGTSVGPLKAASSGVVQVLAPNSIEVSDYGQYDTSTIEKDVMVTVRATFFVR